MLVTETINKVNIAYETDYTHSIKEYYLYCVGLFKEQLKTININFGFNLLFGDIDYYIFPNSLPTKRVAFQYEHTLVKPGGRDSDGSQQGNISINSMSQAKYLVRLCNYNSLKQSDLIIEYSLPNFINVRSTNLYPAYNNRSLRISACLYDIDFNPNRPIDVMTNFYDINQPRRNKLLKNLKHLGAQNYTDTYGDKLANLYSQAKIVVNVHQTDHHYTLEELRVLPALRRGAIVISEHSALKEFIPYRNNIIWSNYNNIPGVVEDVLETYESYRMACVDQPLREILVQLETNNITEVNSALKRLVNNDY